ncbi:MAG: hypothetical protein M1838_000181 [Thelocarpon superellum]|nr:MAG: hypothetical protein M1838_000181 [Thelocarpon superellum]
MSASRRLYQNDVDFAALAAQDADVKSSGQVNFNDPAAVQSLTKALLKRDFDLELALPEDRLCPPVPNRLNYILWLQDLLDTTAEDFRDAFDPAREVVGLDIGTGASAIYPLLGCSQRRKWIFAGTDIDEKSIRYAQENVARNSLKSRIKIVKTTPSGPLLPLDMIGLERIDFTMCNPPFYGSVDEMVSSAKRKQRPPFSACTGSQIEMVTLGGEVAFVERMIVEGLKLKERVRWYTTMLGKLSSVYAMVPRLEEARVTNWAVTEFIQGSKTRRWAIAWSWGDLRPSMSVCRGIPGLPKHLLPFPSEYLFNLSPASIDACAQRLNTTMDALALRWRWKPSLCTGVGFAEQNVWSRSARRKHASPGRRSGVDGGAGGDGEDEDDEDDEDDETEPALGIKIQLRVGYQGSGVDVMIRWLKGRDSVIFESFCGMLKRKMEEA